MKKTSKLISLILSLVLIFTISVSAFAEGLPKGAVLITGSEKIKSDDFRIVAYRGLSACAPENTLAAISLAGRCGCYGCEIDVQPTLDGRWICLSDLSLDRTTDGIGVVNAISYADLANVRIDVGNNISEYPNEKIPTVEEAVSMCQLYGMKIILTIKNGTSENIDSLLSSLRLLGIIKSTTIISTNPDILKQVKDAGGSPAYNCLAITDNMVSTCLSNGYVGISASTTLSSTSAMKRAAENGLEVYAFDIDTLSKAESFYQNGIKTVLSSSLVMHEPDAENITASVFSKLTSFFKTIIEFFTKIFRQIFLSIALDEIFG